jgi:hypothetical protein
MKTNFCISYGEKGGVGKSTNSILFADIIRLLKIHFALYDCDPTNPVLSRYFATRGEDGKKLPVQNPQEGVALLKVSDRDSFLNFIASLPQMPVPVLLDFPGGEVATLKSLDDTLFMGDFLREAGIPTTIFFSTDGMKDSIFALKRAMKRYEFAKFVLFQSERFSPNGQFPDIDGDAELQGLFSQNPPIRVNIPCFPLSLLKKIDNLNLPPSVAAAPTCDKLLMAERICLAGYVRRVRENLATVLELFGAATQAA